MSEDNTTTDQTSTMNNSSTPPIMDNGNTSHLLTNVNINSDPNKQYDNDNGNGYVNGNANDNDNDNNSDNDHDNDNDIDKDNDHDHDNTNDNANANANDNGNNHDHDNASCIAVNISPAECAKHTVAEPDNTFAVNKNIAEGMMDIALLSANANQLRFLITYNRKATFFYISLILVIVSLLLQLAVGIGLLIRRWYRFRIKQKEPHIMNAFIVGGVFVITIVNILLAALSTTDNNIPNS